MQNDLSRPKVGVALSGASGRAIAHIGALEVFKENNIPVDCIVGCSSGALIAASYAIGTMNEMKSIIFDMTFPKMFRMWSLRNASGGLFHLHAADEVMMRISKGLKVEDIKHPKLGLVATDLETAQLINIQAGDMLSAFKASVAIPGLFEPTVINGRILVDGGLVNIVPTKVAKEMGADIVIGINIAATKFIYEKRLPIWRGYRFLTRLLGLQFLREKILPMLSSRLLFQFDSQSDLLEEEDIKVPGMLTVLAKALDHSLIISEQWKESDMACDLMLEPRVKHFGKVQLGKLEEIYLEGRRAASAVIPEIKKIIAAKKLEMSRNREAEKEKETVR
jgi:NTE family protein